MSDEAASTDLLISHFSSLNKLLLATAWILRFKQYLQSRARGSDSSISNQPITTTELEQAEIALVKYVQLSGMGFEVKWKEETGKTAQIAQFAVAQPCLDFRGDESRKQASKCQNILRGKTSSHIVTRSPLDPTNHSRLSRLLSWTPRTKCNLKLSDAKILGHKPYSCSQSSCKQVPPM